ncbi:hypothetical protein TNCV_4708121 [Trichonephila clavipes]|nr:hypothetical protein TNCV_4708121 [Trichonephila clavipes]
MLVRVYEDHTLSVNCVYEWFAHFEKESVYNNLRSKRPTNSVRDEDSEKGTTPVRTTNFMVLCSRQYSTSHSQYHQTFSGRKKGGVQIEHLSFSPDLSPPDFFLFPRLKLDFKGKWFDNISDIQRSITRLLNSISKEDFLLSFQDMYSSAQQCTVMGGDYFEGQTATAGSDVVQFGRPIFDDFFQHLWPYIGNNTANVVFQMVKRWWLIRTDQ